MDGRDEREREEEGCEEVTNFDEDDERPVDIGGMSDARKREIYAELYDGVPDTRFEGGTFNCSVTRDRKEFLSRHLGQDINVKDGENSRELIHNTFIKFHEGERSGIKYKGVKVVVSRDRGKPLSLVEIRS